MSIAVHFSPFRCIPHPIPNISLHLWHSCLLPGGGLRPVHQWGGYYLLEEDQSIVWRYLKAWVCLQAVTMQIFTTLFWNFLVAGLGYGTQVIVTLLNFYYIVVLAWGIFYLSFSFSWDLAWSSCNNTWNTGKSWKHISSTVFWQFWPLPPLQKTAWNFWGQTLQSITRPTQTLPHLSWSSGSEFLATARITWAYKLAMH